MLFVESNYQVRIQKWPIFIKPLAQFGRLTAGFEVIYEQRERVFHRDIQTRENNV